MGSCRRARCPLAAASHLFRRALWRRLHPAWGRDIGKRRRRCRLERRVREVVEALAAAAVAAGAGALALAGSLAICIRRAGLKIRYVLTPRRATSIALAAMLVVSALVFVSTDSGSSFVVLVLVSLLLGAHVPFAMEISEIPVAIPLVTCAAGFAGAAIGFAFDNLVLIITGGLIVSSMMVLAMAMCRDTGRYFVSVILGER